MQIGLKDASTLSPPTHHAWKGAPNIPELVSRKLFVFECSPPQGVFQNTGEFPEVRRRFGMQPMGWLLIMEVVSE